MEKKINLRVKEIPHKVFHFASAWWRRNIAPIRQEHIFVRILFAITILHLLYGVFLLSFMLLGANHPLACGPLEPIQGYPLCDALLHSTAHTLFAHECIAGDGALGAIIIKVVSPLLYAPVYLIIIYILNKVTGYNKITLLNCIAVYFIFSIIMLVVMLVGGYIIGYLFIEILPSIGEIPSVGNGRLCHWDCNLVATWLLILFLLLFCCFGIVRRLYPDNIFIYRCIYGSMAMFWYISASVLHMVLWLIARIFYDI